MLTRLSLLIGFGLFIIGHALPDIIDVTVNGTVSGSGQLTGFCTVQGIPPPPECFPNPEGGPLYIAILTYSFNDANTQLGAFTGSGSAGGPSTPLSPASVGSSAAQSATASADSIDLTLTGGYSLIQAAISFNTSEQDNISVGFDLTEASLVKLSGEVNPGFADNVGELKDAHGNTILALPYGVLSTSALLQPGQYYLDSSVMGSDKGNLVGSSTSGVDFNLSLDATFTTVTAIPEPRWTIFGVLIAVLLGRYMFYERQRSSA